MKKFVSSLAAIALTGLMPVAASAATYTTTYFNYGTTSTINRAEFVQLAMQQAGMLYADGTNCFTDVRSQPFAPYVCAAKQMGVITGYPNGAYRPNNAITFVEAAAIAVRVNGGLQTGGFSTLWYQPYLETLAAWNAIPQNTTNILAPVSHAQAVEMLSAVANRNVDDDYDYDAGDDDDDNDDDDSDSDDDMKLTITVSDDEVDAGDRVTFRIKLENRSDDDIDDIEVIAELDNDMEYVSSSDDGDEDDDEVEWDDIEVDEDRTKTLLLTVEIDDDADEDDILRLRVKAENGDELTATKSIRVDDEKKNDDEDVSISITDSEDPVQEGDEFTYHIKIKNEDNDDIRVDVVATLDEDVSFVSASDGGDKSGDEVEWDDIRLDEDESKTLTLRVKVRSSARDGQDLVLKVEANDEEEEEETEVEDDDDDDDTGDEDIDVTITASDDDVQEGDTVIYRIELENNDNDDVEVDVRADLDDGMSFLSASLNGRLIGDDEVRWDDVEIDEDDDRILLLTIRINNKVDDGDRLRLTVKAGDGEDSITTRIDQ